MTLISTQYDNLAESYGQNTDTCVESNPILTPIREIPI
jgi:hypothetical protein